MINIHQLLDQTTTDNRAQGFSEALADERIVAPFIESGLDWIEDYDAYEKRDGGHTVYVGIIPIPDDDGAPLAYVVPQVESASILSNVSFSVLRIVIEFSGIFVALIAFGLWISRYYMIYPIRMSDLKSDLVIPQPESSGLYRIEAIRRKDHALVRITDAERVQEVILALPDNTRFMYLAVTGEHCEIYNLLVKTDVRVLHEESE